MSNKFSCLLFILASCIHISSASGISVSEDRKIFNSMNRIRQMNNNHTRMVMERSSSVHSSWMGHLKVIQILDNKSCLAEYYDENKGERTTAHITGVNTNNLVDGDYIPQNNFFWYGDSEMYHSSNSRMVKLEENGTYSYKNVLHAKATIKSFIYKPFLAKNIEKNQPIKYLGTEIGKKELIYMWKKYAKHIYKGNKGRNKELVYIYDPNREQNIHDPFHIASPNDGWKHINANEFKWYLHNGGKIYFLARHNNEKGKWTLLTHQHLQKIMNNLKKEREKETDSILEALEKDN